MTQRVLITQQALALLQTLKAKHGELIFHQSGGCCDGSAPMCLLKNEFKTGGADVCLGEVDDVAFWMSFDQFKYWEHTQLTIDVVKGRGTSFSLEIPTGFRFIIQSRIFTDEEREDLVPVVRGSSPSF